MTDTKRHSAGRANYAGRIDDMAGELRGPTTYGSILIATGQTYDEATDRTVVVFSHATADDTAEARAVLDAIKEGQGR